MDGFQTKICSNCKVEQHLYFFRFNPLRGNYESWCDQCKADKALNAKYRHTNKPSEESEMKFCYGCGETKPLSEYYFHRSLNVYDRECKICRKNAVRKSKLKNKYGVDETWRESTLVAQNNKCAICKIPLSGMGFDPVIDHNAFNGKARAILCRPCNILLGLHHENCETLRMAGFDRHAEYIEHYKRVHEIKLVG